MANSRSFPLRHAVLHLSRPGNQTRVILLAVGLGAFFIVGVRSLQASLLSEFSLQVSADAPDMFLLDIQKGQADGVRAFLDDPGHGAGAYQLIPVLRARVVGVPGARRSTARRGARRVRSAASSRSPTRPLEAQRGVIGARSGTGRRPRPSSVEK
jgi:putative ABC transport system permease protein